MGDKGKIELVKQMLETATANLASAKHLLGEMLGTSFDDISLKASQLAGGEGEYIEGLFDGQFMIDKDGKKYPVPANYASKSKLVVGDVLKLTIQSDGAYLYKQISPIERKNLIGTLVYEDDQYRVVSGGQSYNVLTASVTYFKLKPGDQVTIVIPQDGDVTWAAVESAVID